MIFAVRRLLTSEGGKSFNGELEGEGTCSVLDSQCWPDVKPFHGVLSLLNFLIL